MKAKFPQSLARFFWDCDFTELSWEKHPDFIIRRLLQFGDWEALTWLRGEMGDAALRAWIEQQRGAGLSPRQLRFWELVLDLPGANVSRWVHAAAKEAWQRRLVH